MKQLFPQALLGAMLFGTHLAGSAQAPAVQPPVAPAVIQFHITHFDVSGNTLLSPTDIEKAVAPYIGENRNFGDVQQALEALETVYRDRGFNVVQVQLPEQELTVGIIRLQVSESRIKHVFIEGNHQFSDSNIRQSLPGLQEGDSPNTLIFSRSLRIANENPAKKLSLQLESADTGDDINARLKVTEDKVWRVATTLDNTGTAETGNTRAGLSLQHANLFGRDHVGSLQYTTSPQNPSQVKVYGLGYHVPLYESGNSMDFYGSYSDVNSGSVSAGLVNLDVSGKGRVWGARYNHNLRRSKNYETKLTYGLDYKAFENGVRYSGLQLGHDIVVRPLSLAFSGNWTLDQGEANASLSLARNIAGGDKGEASDFQAVRVNSTPNYLIWRYAANYARPIWDSWQMRFALSGQYTADALIPGEQFGAGGASSVRGYSERAFSNDYGAQMNAEVYTPNLCSGMGSPRTQCRLLAFYDTAYLARNEALPGEDNRTTVSSVGLGLRLSMDKYFNFQGDYGHGLNSFSNIDSNRLHFRINLSY